MDFNNKLIILQERFFKYLEETKLKNKKELTFNDYCTLWLIDPTQCAMTEEEEIENEVLTFQND